MAVMTLLLLLNNNVLSARRHDDAATLGLVDRGHRPGYASSFSLLLPAMALNSRRR
jgi:hypothetical protein